jgi:hypothetical protein
MKSENKYSPKTERGTVMAKCYFTGVEQPTEEMFILDNTAARKAVQNLRRQAAAVEQIMEQLNGKDAAEVYNCKFKKSLTLRFFRLVTPTVAQALSAACPEAGLFMPWHAFKARRRERIAKQKSSQQPVMMDDSSPEPITTSGGMS